MKEAAVRKLRKEELKEEWKKDLKKELKISGRKDWIIFWFFAVMISYVAGGWLARPINEWLGGMTGPWLTDLNMPSNYGRTIGAVLLLAALTEILLLFRKKNVKAKIGVAVAGVALAALIVGIHQVHCRLIVSVLHSEEPKSMTLFLDGRQERLVSEEECRELLELCRGLEVITDSEELADCLVWYEEKGIGLGSANSVWLTFPQKYGHGYVLQLNVQDGYSYLWRGYLGDEKRITFFRDNGLTEWLEERKNGG